MPRFTIGIPTYNRAEFLKRSIPTALEQTAADVEIIVCDNASTDHTAEVVASFGGRVRYHRNETNLGVTANFQKAVDLATSDYFSWLQDDDLIHRDFAQRALSAFAAADDVAAYACFSVSTQSPTTFYHSFLTGPAVPLRWMQGGITLLDGILVAPVSLFYSFGNPPALAYRTRDLRTAIATTNHRCILFDERILLAATVVDARVAIDPWPGAIFFDHQEQDYKRIFREQPLKRTSEWFTLTEAISDLLKDRGDAWKKPTSEYFANLPIPYRLNWLRYYCPEVNAWQRANPLTQEVWKLLIASLPAEARPAHLDRKSPIWLIRGRAKSLVKDLIPPLVWKAMRKGLQVES